MEHILDGLPSGPAGVVGIEHAVEALRLADVLRPALMRCRASASGRTTVHT